MDVGDTFILNVLDRTLTYEVDRILIVLPEETEELYINDNEDYCTLVTCTPYGINTHRILVRGHRIETEKTVGAVRVTADAVKVEPLLVAPALAVPILLLFACGMGPMMARIFSGETSFSSFVCGTYGFLFGLYAVFFTYNFIGFTRLKKKYHSQN